MHFKLLKVTRLMDRITRLKYELESLLKNPERESTRVRKVRVMIKEAEVELQGAT